MTAHEKYMLANRHIGADKISVAILSAKLEYKLKTNSFYRIRREETQTPFNRLNIFNF